MQGAPGSVDPNGMLAPWTSTTFGGTRTVVPSITIAGGTTSTTTSFLIREYSIAANLYVYWLPLILSTSTTPTVWWVD